MPANGLEFVNLPITAFGYRSIGHNAVIFHKKCRDAGTRTLALAVGTNECPQRADSGSHLITRSTYSALMPDALMIGHHFSISAR